jgi:hypothetical protein
VGGGREGREGRERDRETMTSMWEGWSREGGGLTDSTKSPP